LTYGIARKGLVNKFTTDRIGDPAIWSDHFLD
jgi:hypothetical protein